jgi:hypothetical protein
MFHRECFSIGVKEVLHMHKTGFNLAGGPWSC